ncbi:hypothetical protein GPECTOR_20g460 [Gonium pectorale]|uniref:Uncharacterized protein n=1 Tax=Gonium pectorale TaxID=33097 RepID=A0A150GIG2_GONPE|nr:hypothetical protein GPECTOR_20g460 [Gonium pectorale]|eukprot:KXZ49604.1 hypothetical protein GPECTOR_20g460 [Gonium pectorale]
MVSWLVEALGAEAVRLDGDLFEAAAHSGNVELMVWLRERGCMTNGAFALWCVAGSGCEAALEWLVEECGCPLEDADDAYHRPCVNGDLAMLRCLRRLGVPADKVGVYLVRAPLTTAMLRWLLEEGFPLDPAMVSEEVGRCEVPADAEAAAGLAGLQVGERAAARGGVAAL